MNDSEAGPSGGTVEAIGLSLVEAFYDAMRRGDVAGVLDLTVENVIVVQSERLPWGGRFQGRDGLARFAAGVRAHVVSEVIVERAVAAGDRIAVTGWTRGSVVRTGHAFQVPLVHLFTVADGKLQALEVLVDVPAMSVALAWNG